MCSFVYFQKQPPEVFFKRKGVLRIFSKFTGKHLCHRCFPVNNAKFLKIPFLPGSTIKKHFQVVKLKLIYVLNLILIKNIFNVLVEFKQHCYSQFYQSVTFNSIYYSIYNFDIIYLSETIWFDHSIR